MFRRTWSLIPVLAMLAGCAPGNPGLVVLNVVAPDESCSYAVGNEQFSRGTFDVSRPASYVAWLRFGNQLLNLGRTGSAGPPMADPNMMQVQELEVELQDIAGATLGLAGLPNPFTVPGGGGLIPSGDSGTAGEGLGSAELIPDVYRGELAAYAGSEIVISIRAIGQTLGGAEVVSYPFRYPVFLCSGCLYACQRDADMVPVCSPACTPGQDSINVTPLECGEDTACQVGGT